jgi:hypothetical protein
VTIEQIIAAADTTSNNLVNRMTSGNMEAILIFAEHTTAESVAMTLREAGALVTTKDSGYGETLLIAVWQA